MTEDFSWKPIYKLGGISALVFVPYSLVTIIVFMFLSQMPETALEAFNALQENRFLGLLRMDALTLIIVPLYYVIYLCIFNGIKKTNHGFASLGTLLAFAGITLFLATPTAFSLVPLSEKYAAASEPAQRAQFLAGEALMAADMWHSSGAMLGGFLMLIAALIVSIIMLKSENFSRATAIVGVVTYGFDLANKLVSIFDPQIGILFMMVSGPLYLVWFPLLARDFFRLAQKNSISSLSST